MGRLAILTTTALVSIAFASQVYAASPFTSQVVFGDSLSDDGNISLASGFPTIMKFTTNPGPVSVEDLAAFYGLSLKPSLLGGSDYAWGGAGIYNNAPGTPAGVPTVTTQIQGYLAANPKLSGTTLYTVLGGANDIFYAAAATSVNAETSAQAAAAISAAATQEVTLIGGLKAAGAKYIVVFNLPDIGLTPLAASEGAAGQAGLTALSSGFNTVLNGGLGVIGTNIVPVNTFALLHELVASPTQYGFTNTTTPACTTSSSLLCSPATLVVPNAGSTYLFADGVHPTTALHALIAQAVEAELAGPQQTSLLAEAPVAFLQADRDAVQGQLQTDSLAPTQGVRLFAVGGYVGQTLKSQGYTPQASNHDGLITVGVDYGLSSSFSIGAALTDANTTDHLGGGVGGFDVDSLQGSVFGQYVWNHQAYINGDLGFGSLSFNKIQRQFKLGAATRVENGETSGTTFKTDLTAGYWFGPQAFRTGPYLALNYAQIKVDAFNEAGGDSTAMTFGAQSRNVMVTEVGWKAEATLKSGSSTIRPFAAVAYDNDADASQRSVTGGLTTMNGTFSMPGYAPQKTWASAQVGVNAQLVGGWSAAVAYHGRFGDSRGSYNEGTVGLSYAF